VLIQYEFNNYDRSYKSDGINLEVELKCYVVQVIQQYRDDHNLDLTDIHIRAYVNLQYKQQQDNDKIRIRIKHTSSELRQMTLELPEYAEVALGILI
jgi:hypothetical protein